MTLSLKHLQVRDFILRYQAQHGGAAPSQKTVYLSLGMAQWQVSRYIKKLEKAGELKRPGYRTPKAERKALDSDFQEDHIANCLHCEKEKRVFKTGSPNEWILHMKLKHGITLDLASVQKAWGK